MARLNLGWFEFNGIKSSDMGVRIVGPQSYTSGLRRGSEEPVAGKNGYTWLSDETREQYDIKRTCHVHASARRAVKSWLSGSGALRFSGEADAQYEARIIGRIDYKQICPGEDPIYEFQVSFTVQPDPYVYPPAGVFVATAQGMELPTPENAYGLPIITIFGSGNFSLTIGNQTAYFSGVADGIILDSELGDALTLDFALLANDKVNGDLFELGSGPNVISWQLGGEDETGNASDGSIESVSILPRWRWK